MKRLPATTNRHNALRNHWSIPSVDQIIIEERATAFTKRSIKTSAKLSGLKLAVSMTDLTTLEGRDTPGKVAFLCKAMQPAASVATAFPAGLMPLDLKLEEVRRAAGDGADEIDMVIDRGVFLAGDYNRVSTRSLRRRMRTITPI